MLAARTDALEEFKDRTLRKIAEVRCPRHHKAPQIKFHGSTLRDITIRMSGCCARLIDIANRAITDKG